jgi:hypothetical protein
MPALDSRRFVSTEEVREALRLPSNFSARDDRLGETWGLGPTLECRDSGYLAKANAEALLQHLRSDESLEEDWYSLRASHWAVGWCEQIAFRVLDADGKPSRIFKVLLDWRDMLEEYLVADDALMSEYRRDEILDYLRFGHIRGLKDDLPEDWVEKLADELERINAVQDEPSGDIFIDSADLEEAVKNLGYQEAEDV